MNENYMSSCFRWLLTKLFPMYHNKQLSKEVSSCIDIFYKSVASSIDWGNITKEDAITLGFLNWNEDFSGPWLIPCWMFPLVPEGAVLYDNDDKPFVFKKTEASVELLFGCLTYGIHVKENA